MNAREELAAIVDRLSSIRQSIERYIKAEESERKRQQERENLPIQVAGTIGLPEGVEAQRAVNEEQSQTTQKSTARAAWVGAFAAWAAFFAALLYASLTWSQLNVAKQQARTAQDSVTEFRREFELDQRAWVGIGDVTTLDFEVGKNARFDVEIRNVGKTPATNVFLCGLAFSPEGQDPCPIDGTIARPDVIHLNINPVMPNSVNHQWVGTIYPLLKSDFERKIGMRLVGTIWYYDAFQVDHWVRFCRYYDAQNSRFEACEDHNDFDHNGMTYALPQSRQPRRSGQIFAPSTAR